jgi:tetratricopeptide (TPR) repeat protein
LVLRSLGEPEEAKASLQKSLDILRRLAYDESQVYEHDIARTLINLGLILHEDLREFEGARQAFQDTLIIYQHLASSQSQAHEIDFARVYRNLGMVLWDLHEFRGAKENLQKSLDIFQRLACDQPQTYEFDVAKVHSDLGLVLQDLGEFEGARQALKDALAIYQRLACDQPQTYEFDVARSLSSLGLVLQGLGEFKEAKETQRNVLDIFRRLACDQPQTYEPRVAQTLGNLGSVLWDLGTFEEARETYQEAAALFEKYDLWLDSSLAYNHWAGLEYEGGDLPRALELSETAIEHCERGLGQLVERNHRNLFKSRIEQAYLRLIAYEAHHLDGSIEQPGRHLPASMRLVALLESLRQIETLAGLGEAVSSDATPWKTIFLDLLHDTGDLAARFRVHGGVLLWVHATLDNVVFVILSPGMCQVSVTNRVLLEKFRALSAAFNDAISAWEQLQRSVNKPTVAAQFLNTCIDYSNIQFTADEVYHYLPEAVKAVLTDRAQRTIFLAPCAATVNLPWELIRIPTKDWQHHNEAKTYVGLQHLLPRIHSLNALHQALARQPASGDDFLHRGMAKRAVVIGNPLHNDAPPLYGSRSGAQSLSMYLKISDYKLLPDGKALLDEDATVGVITVSVNSFLDTFGPKLGRVSQGTPLRISHLGRRFVAMPPNEPGLIVLTLELVQRQAQLFHGIKSCEP